MIRAGDRRPQLLFSSVNEFESFEEALQLHVAVKWRIVIGSCTLGIQTPLQLTMLNVMGALCDLFDVSMDI